MRLAHKTTVLLSESLHRQLTQLAQDRGESLGGLVRQACERQYGDERLAAVEAMKAMRLPVGPVEQNARSRGYKEIEKSLVAAGGR